MGRATSALVGSAQAGGTTDEHFVRADLTCSNYPIAHGEPKCLQLALRQSRRAMGTPLYRTLRLRTPDPSRAEPQIGRTPLDGPTVRRLQRATRRIKAFRDDEAGTHFVYVALLRDVPGEGPFSFYVGMTGIGADERYLQHLAGVKAGKLWIKKYSIGLIPRLMNRFNPMSHDDARIVEMALLWRLCEAGFDVHGA